MMSLIWILVLLIYVENNANVTIFNLSEEKRFQQRNLMKKTDKLTSKRDLFGTW